MMKQGKLVSYFENRGFGFIEEEDTAFPNVYFHVTECKVKPLTGLRVQYETKQGPKGPVAVGVDHDIVAVLSGTAVSR